MRKIDKDGLLLTPAIISISDIRKLALHGVGNRI